jgi:hypothetical protein
LTSMSAVSMPMPITRIRTRTIRFGPVLGACFSCSRRAFSIWWICSATSCFRVRSRSLCGAPHNERYVESMVMQRSYCSDGRLTLLSTA